MTDMGKSSSGKLQARRVRKSGWITERREIFLAMLGTTCNVDRSARAAGLRSWSARQLRDRDPEFARLWDDAMAKGAEFLREQLMARALGTSGSGDNPQSVGEEALEAAERDAAAQFDPQLALQCLKLESGRGGRRGAVAKAQVDLDTVLLRRLDAIAARRRGAA
jgi:hypothetical protein